MKKLTIAILAAFMSVAFAGAYAATDGMKKDEKAMAKGEKAKAKGEKSPAKGAMAADDTKKKKAKGKKKDVEPKK